jgi:hypothetical protein
MKQVMKLGLKFFLYYFLIIRITIDAQPIRPDILTFEANPSTIDYNTSTTISYTVRADSCWGLRGDKFWQTTKSNIGGNYYSTRLKETTEFILMCRNDNGITVMKNIYVNVKKAPAPLPTLELSANPIIIDYNGSTVINWKATNSIRCKAVYGTKQWSSMGNISMNSGSFNVIALDTTTTFSCFCYNSDTVGITKSITIYVNSQDTSSIKPKLIEAKLPKKGLTTDNNNLDTKIFEKQISKINSIDTMYSIEIMESYNSAITKKIIKAIDKLSVKKVKVRRKILKSILLNINNLNIEFDSTLNQKKINIVNLIHKLLGNNYILVTENDLKYLKYYQYYFRNFKNNTKLYKTDEFNYIMEILLTDLQNIYPDEKQLHGMQSINDKELLPPLVKLYFVTCYLDNISRIKNNKYLKLHLNLINCRYKYKKTEEEFITKPNPALHVTDYKRKWIWANIESKTYYERKDFDPTLKYFDEISITNDYCIVIDRENYRSHLLKIVPNLNFENFLKINKQDIEDYFRNVLEIGKQQDIHLCNVLQLYQNE